MKTETQIAERSIGRWKLKDMNIVIHLHNCMEHKATCQRFLEFLESYGLQAKEKLKIISKKIVENSSDSGVGFIIDMLDEKEAKIKIKDKITDLKQAIKLYEDAGIK